MDDLAIKNGVLFSEKQYFRQWWLWLILIGCNALFLFMFIAQVIGGQPIGDQPMSDWGLTLSCILFLLMSVWFYTLHLETIITKDEIRVRFFPFQLAYRTIAWEDLSEAFVRQYDPLGEFGGWGLRLGLFGRGRALNVSGNKGIQLIFKNGSKLLIGTREPEQAALVLRKMGYMPPNDLV